jgi:small subunit ribosomal protein S24e
MTDKSFMLYCRKMLNNPLLARKQVMCELIHPDSAGVTKEAIKKKLSEMYKTPTDAICVFGCKLKFGGGRSSCFALIYKNVDLRKKFDSKILLHRDFGKAKTTGRKQKKEMKGREKRVTGTAKAKARSSSGKKK